MLSFNPIAGSPLSSLPPLQIGDSIQGVEYLLLSISQPLLVFQLAGTATLDITPTGGLTINIELEAQNSLDLGPPEAFLTVGYRVSGQVTEMGVPVQRTLRVYDASSGVLLVTGQSDPGTGEYALDLFAHGDDIYVQCLGSVTYGPLIHGPIEPERL